MKKVFLSMIAAALSFGAFAQDTTKPATPPTEQQPQHQQKDMYMFRNSKMWEVKNGTVVTELTKDVTLKNGTVVKTNGEIIKDGQTIKLKDGQYIDVDGNIGETN